MISMNESHMDFLENQENESPHQNHSKQSNQSKQSNHIRSINSHNSSISKHYHTNQSKYCYSLNNSYKVNSSHDDTLESSDIGHDNIHLHYCANSTKISNYSSFPWKSQLTRVDINEIKLHEIINYTKLSSTPRKMPLVFCSMCGKEEVEIPTQNKNICKICDSTYWYLEKYKVVLKFCKGRYDINYIIIM